MTDEYYIVEDLKGLAVVRGWPAGESFWGPRQFKAGPFTDADTAYEKMRGIGSRRDVIKDVLIWVVGALVLGALLWIKWEAL